MRGALRAAALAAALLPRPSAAQADSARILIVYFSATGNTARAAQAVADGARSVAGARVTLHAVDRVTHADLARADGLILGSPTYYANIAAPMKAFIDGWFQGEPVYFGGKVAGAFATGGGDAGGKEHVVTSLLLALLNNGAMVVGPEFEVGGVPYANYGATATTPTATEPLTDTETDALRRLGARVARVALRQRRN